MKNNNQNQQSTMTLSRVKDQVTTDNHGIILLNHKSIQAIYDQSGPLAKSCEFQVHYWTLNLRYRAEDNSILDIAIPTCYFNYEQQVSGAHIDFELADVKSVSEQVEPIHNMKANQLLSLGIVQSISSIFNLEFEAMSSHTNSIHRHPGGSSSQAFSGTDLMKTADNLGVVFPLEEASDDTPNFAGIMALDSGVNNIAHYEYRTVNGKLGTDITYTKGMCTAITIKPTYTPSTVASLFGATHKLMSTRRYSNSAKAHPILDKLESTAESIYIDNGFEASVDLVIPSNVAAKPRTTTTASTRRSELYKMQPYQLNPILRQLLEASGQLEHGYIWSYQKPALIDRILKEEAEAAKSVATTSFAPQSTVPDNPVEHYKDVKFLSRAQLVLLTDIELAKMYDQVNALYYSVPNATDTMWTTAEDAIDEILLILEGIEEEINEADPISLAIDNMQGDLIASGFDATYVEDLSEEDINRLQRSIR